MRKIALLTTIFLCACSKGGNLTTGPAQGDSFRDTTAPSASAYTSIALLLQPVFSLFLGNSVDTSASGSVTLAAYTDSGCTLAATGILSATQNPVTAASGIATFAGVSYALPGHLEQAIYLGASAPGGFSACTSAIDILYQFNVGTGYVTGSAASVAGNTPGGISFDWFSLFPSQLDSQGRLVIAGGTTNGSGGVELAIWRYNPDGTLDTTFGGTGMVTPGSTGAAGGTGAGENDTGTALQIDSQNRIVVAGASENTNGGYEMAVWRYTQSGTLDTNFGGTGVVTSGSTGAVGGTGSSEYDQATEMQIDSQGHIIIAGSSAPGTAVPIWRYNTDGTLDTTFGGTGIVLGGNAGFGYNQPTAMNIDSQGRLVMASVYQNASGGFSFTLSRYKTDGTLDTTFGGAGTVPSQTTDAAGATGYYAADQPQSMQFDSQGRIVMAGTSQNGDTSWAAELALWRYNSDGSLDTTFGGVGYVTSGATGAAGASGSNEYDYAQSLQIDSQGRLVIAGNSAKAGGGSELAIWRYNTDGSLDTTFGGTGIVISGTTGAAGGTAGSESDAGYSLHLDWQGRLIIAGSSNDNSGNDDLAIWRYLPNGQLDK